LLFHLTASFISPPVDSAYSGTSALYLDNALFTQLCMIEHQPMKVRCGGPMSAELPLTGITVVSCEQAVAAPFASRQLADLGARVIKVERPGVGDFARGYDPTVQGLWSHFVWINRDKKSVTRDLKHHVGERML